MHNRPRDTIGAMTPDEAWAAMRDDPRAMLVDVRTQAEWAFVGTADTRPIERPQCFIEWKSFPDMRPNERFLAVLRAEIHRTGATSLYFICRSGGRSHDAACAALALRDDSNPALSCTNVLEGFEGDLDGESHRGSSGGWKARNLPWRQT
jgi:rhodanese-related sulfurtransferase